MWQKINLFYFHISSCNSVVEWWSYSPQVVGSNPAASNFFFTTLLHTIENRCDSPSTTQASFHFGALSINGPLKILRSNFVYMSPAHCDTEIRAKVNSDLILYKQRIYSLHFKEYNLGQVKRPLMEQFYDHTHIKNHVGKSEDHKFSIPMLNLVRWNKTFTIVTRDNIWIF